VQLEREIRLPDGRRLGFAEFGHPGGQPLIGIHGGLSCRLEGIPCEECCLELGIRLILPDRPGIGRSDPQPQRQLLDWPNDLFALADALGLSRFALYGWSAGGPYALACALRNPERLTHVASVAGIAPLTHPKALSRLGLAADRLLFRLCRTSPGSAAALLSLARLRRPGATRRQLLRALERSGDPDAQLLAELEPGLLTASFYEAMRSGTHGTALDYALLAREWGFGLSDVPLPVEVWHGEEDGLVPVRHAHRLARALPGARLVLVPGRGHFLPWLHCRSLFASLLASAQAVPLLGARRATGQAPAGEPDPRPRQRAHDRELQGVLPIDAWVRPTPLYATVFATPAGSSPNASRPQR